MPAGLLPHLRPFRTYDPSVLLFRGLHVCFSLQFPPLRRGLFLCVSVFPLGRVGENGTFIYQECPVMSCVGLRVGCYFHAHMAFCSWVEGRCRHPPMRADLPPFVRLCRGAVFPRISCFPSDLPVRRDPPLTPSFRGGFCMHRRYPRQHFSYERCGILLYGTHHHGEMTHETET